MSTGGMKPPLAPPFPPLALPRASCLVFFVFSVCPLSVNCGTRASLPHPYNDNQET